MISAGCLYGASGNSTNIARVLRDYGIFVENVLLQNSLKQLSKYLYISLFEHRFMVSRGPDDIHSP